MFLIYNKLSLMSMHFKSFCSNRQQLRLRIVAFSQNRNNALTIATDCCIIKMKEVILW
nr:MAG TPA: hypothetical protein [Caudoviricetes sp.]